MAETSADRSLLEALRDNAGCTYLSDLHQQDNKEDILRAVSETDADKYSAAEWNEAVTYISGDSAGGHTPDEAKEFLKTFLSNK